VAIDVASLANGIKDRRRMEEKEKDRKREWTRE
jgi:hypothetical protein